MTVAEIQSFCRDRGVEVCARYSDRFDSIIFTMKKNGRMAKKAIKRETAVATLGEAVRDTLQQMSDQLEGGEEDRNDQGL